MTFPRRPSKITEIKIEGGHREVLFDAIDRTDQLVELFRAEAKSDPVAFVLKLSGALGTLLVEVESAPEPAREAVSKLVSMVQRFLEDVNSTGKPPEKPEKPN